MTEQDRDFLVEMAIMITGYSRKFCEKMHIKELEQYYLDYLGEGAK